jgi:hypothetical protein
VKVSLAALDDMRSKGISYLIIIFCSLLVEDYCRNFKEVELDANNKPEDDIKEVNKKVPLKEGVLKSNIGLPIMVVVNKVNIYLYITSVI